MKILYYSKVLYPKVGGYISSANNLIKALGLFCEVYLLLNDETITESDVEYIKRNFPVKNVFNLSETDLAKIKELYDLEVVFYNGTNENDYLHHLFHELGFTFVTYEHQVPSKNFTSEFSDRIKMANLTLVPSESLQQEVFSEFNI